MTRLGIFLLYSPKGIVYDYVMYLLRDMMKNLDDLVIISNGYLREDGRERLKELTPRIHERPNVGFDAAGWQDGMLKVCGMDQVRQYDELILFNDSFFGPLYPFKDVFDEMDGRDLDFWGLSVHGVAKSDRNLCPYGNRPRYLQTYFLAIRKRMLMSDAFETYWKKLPVYKDFQTMVEKHACAFTKHFEDLGFRWAAFADTTDLESDDVEKNCSHHMYDSYEMVAHRRLPIIKRKPFIMPKAAYLTYGTANTLKKTLDYIRDHMDYDVKLIWDYLLDNYNLADLRDSLNLTHVLSERHCDERLWGDKKIAVVAHLYYPDLFEYSCELLSHVPKDADVYITTSAPEKKEAIEAVLARRGMTNARVLLVENRGRELSALLVSCADLVREYDYLCFVHDKKSGLKECVTVGAAFRELIMENVLASEAYIQNIVNTFEKDENLGLLTPPNVYHGTYFQDSINFWTICFRKTRDFLGRLGIQGYISEDKPPVAVGSVFWCRTRALKPLFDETWANTDFPEEPLPGDGSISHAIERAFPYIAQSQGYYTATVMTTETAQTEIANFRYMMGETMRGMVGRRRLDLTTFYAFIRTLFATSPILRDVYGRRRYYEFKAMCKERVPESVWNYLRKGKRVINKLRGRES